VRALYEGKHDPLLPRASFYKRVLRHAAAACALVAASLAIGMLGYVLTEHMSTIDAFLNVAMLLGGMGPVNPPTSVAGKIFAGIFALYAGLLFVVCAALVLTPVLHRVLHRFHVSDR
jgi:hypothetical protein